MKGSQPCQQRPAFKLPTTWSRWLEFKIKSRQSPVWIFLGTAFPDCFFEFIDWLYRPCHLQSFFLTYDLPSLFRASESLFVCSGCVAWIHAAAWRHAPIRFPTSKPATHGVHITYIISSKDHTRRYYVKPKEGCILATEQCNYPYLSLYSNPILCTDGTIQYGAAQS